MQQKSLQELLAEAAQTERERQAKKFIELQIEVQSKLFDKAATYNNLVVSLGFASFLAIWGWSRDSLHPWDSNFLIFFIGLALILFVFWNVLTTFLISKQHITMAKALTSNLNDVDKLKALDKARKGIERWSLGYYATWYVVFVATTVLGSGPIDFSLAA